MQKLLIIIGVSLVVMGLSWPWLAKIPLGRLPGDIFVDKPGFKLYFPVTTLLLVSLLISVILWFLKK